MDVMVWTAWLTAFPFLVVFLLLLAVCLVARRAFRREERICDAMATLWNAQQHLLADHATISNLEALAILHQALLRLRREGL
jgi:hypothetical protein